MEEGGEYLDKKKQVVRNLPVAEGEAVLITKKGQIIEVSGAIVLKGKERHFIVPPGNNGNPGFCCQSFGPGTRVETWRPSEVYGPRN